MGGSTTADPQIRTPKIIFESGVSIDCLHAALHQIQGGWSRRP
jgi:hypothetical protein